MTHDLEPGARVTCTEDNWSNAYGDEFEEMNRGYPATVAEAKTIFGARFLQFVEFPGLWFWSAGFRRRLDG